MEGTTEGKKRSKVVRGVIEGGKVVRSVTSYGNEESDVESTSVESTEVPVGG